MDGTATQQTAQPVSIVRFKPVGRACFEFAADHRGLLRLISGADATEFRRAGVADRRADTPLSLLGRSLDSVGADGILDPARRQGAQVKAWSVVHGIAVLWLDDTAPALEARTRAATLDSLMRFTATGLWGEMRVGAARRPS